MIKTLSLSLVFALAFTTYGGEPFAKKSIEGFTVFVSRDALKKDNTGKALEHLQQQLFQVTVTLPPKAVQELRRVPIWFANGEKKLGIAFHPSRKWLTDRGYKPPQPKSLIGIVSGKHFLHEALRQPWLTFHELCHGYDWFTLGRLKQYGNQLNADNYRRAMKSGKYKSALHWNSRRRKPYHATNRMEFFAETSEAFFGTNDIFPFVRAELRDHDPNTYRLLAAQWGVDLKKEHQREAELLKSLSSGSVSIAPLETAISKSLEGWQVRIDNRVDSAQLPQLLLVLRRDLHYVTRYVPPQTLRQMQQSQVWVYSSSSVAHVSHRQGKPGAIIIGNAANYLRFASLQPSVMVKQLAYLQFRRLPAKFRQKWVALYRARKKDSKYRTVLRFDGRRVAHPGLKSAPALFAELSTCRFGTNDHYPFVTAELKDVDREAHQLLTELYGK